MIDHITIQNKNLAEFLELFPKPELVIELLQVGVCTCVLSGFLFIDSPHISRDPQTIRAVQLKLIELSKGIAA